MMNHPNMIHSRNNFRLNSCHRCNFRYRNMNRFLNSFHPNNCRRRMMYSAFGNSFHSSFLLLFCSLLPDPLYLYKILSLLM